LWRLILSENSGFTHDYVFNRMTVSEIEEANTALDLYYKAINKKPKGRR